MNFRFERLSDDNIHHLATLFKSVYKKQIAVSYLQCKYDTSYLHPHKFGYFAFHNNIPVAFSGMIPYLMEYNGKKELSVQTSDSMTHPSYERMGLFKSVAEKSYEDLRRERFSFIWSFPNEASVMAATKKLNWQITAPMTGYCIPVLSKYKAYAIRTANEIFYGKNSLQKIFERELTDEFPVNSLHKSGGVTTVRKVGYFNYKKFGTSCHVKINGIKKHMNY